MRLNFPTGIGDKSNQTMVNLVLRHQESSSLDAAEAVETKSPTAAAGGGMLSPGRAGRGIPPMSPLTQDESMFGARAGPYQSSHATEERDPPPLASPSSKTDLELVCDYDRSVTQLYEMLESSQWKNACSRCQTHPDEVRTWIVRRDANGNIRWKLLPLHAAVIFKAPLSLIDDLLRVYPLSAAKRDDQGIIPLHLAFRHKCNEAVIEKLLHQYPGGVMIKDNRERFPLDHGKDMGFSAKLMGLYAETFTKCQNIETKDVANEEEIAATYEKRLTALKDAYEARIDSLQKTHEEACETMKTRAEKDMQRNREKYIEEIVEINRQLAREKEAGERTPQLEAQVKGLTSSLEGALGELVTLRKVIQDQNGQKEKLAEEMRQILEDQKALSVRCNKQQEQLDQAQKLRKQLLRTLTQKENGKAIQVSSEICEHSARNIARTEKLLSNLSLGPSDPVNEDTSRRLPNNQNDRYQSTEDLPSDCGNPTGTASWSAEPEGDHGDDISAITEGSYTQPFGDR